jgi:hypothetical protein
LRSVLGALFIGGLLLLAAASAQAASAYVSDELVLGVYAQPDLQGQRLATLHSGAAVETLASSGDYTQVRLQDGTTGWVKTAYLVGREPAVARVKRLEDELSNARATTPAMAEAAARSEVARLRGELEAKGSELQAAAASATALRRGEGPQWTSQRRLCVLGAIAALILGFCLGYAVLARRIRSKFGGIKVY